MKPKKKERKERFNLWSTTQNRLIEAAKQAQKMAYCPYSKYPVGAAVLTGSGRIFTGCNMENASFGLSICAERAAMCAAVSHGQKVLRAVAVVARSARPCGACRQVLLEFAEKNADILMVDLDPLRKKQKVSHLRIARSMSAPFNPQAAGL